MAQVGCYACETSMAAALDERNGQLSIHLPDTIVAEQKFTYQLQFDAATDHADLRLVQCIYFGPNDVATQDVAFGHAAARTTHRWDIAWHNPFHGRFGLAPEVPVSSDLFLFDQESLLVHIRISLVLYDVDTESVRLCDAVRDGLVNHVSDILHRGIFLRAVPPPALHEAVKKRYANLIRLLLSHSLPVDGYDTVGPSIVASPLSRTALYVAVEVDAVNIVKLLMARGAMPSNQAAEEAPIFLAIRLGRLEILKHFLCVDAPSVIDAVHTTRRDSRKFSALMYAYKENRPEMALAILDAGASALGPRFGASALYYCIAGLRDEVTQLAHVLMLLERGAATEIHKSNEDESTAMIYAVQTRRYDLVEILAASQEPNHALTKYYRPILYQLALECDDDCQMLCALGLGDYMEVDESLVIDANAQRAPANNNWSVTS
ncbi:hypothetical protein ACHHYP_01117 [Achlya hypogyna]|uniref:Uncharacterized protein n=1 Tax=Achlya hypogyna TaxID=1202772 RepID=A0A1V9Z9Q7_ACHHY|nr:hypothetical protein ACHHYP_01117 [Achlya hypogyna]